MVPGGLPIATRGHATRRAGPTLPAIRWFQKRGVLYLLTQAPMIAFIVGYLLRWTTFRIASLVSLVVLLVALPRWVQYRRRHALAANDPAHQIGRYAVMSLVPVAVYDLVRVPNFYFLESPYWDRWFDFGHEFAGVAPTSWTALIVGTLLHYLQGWSLAFGFYVLFVRHTLPGALVYLFVFLTFTYIVMFVRYADSDLTVSFVYKVAWDHFWMAIAAWGLAELLGRSAKRPQWVTSKVFLSGSLVATAPFAFAFWQARHIVG